jgi:hypothetical protein
MIRAFTNITPITGHVTVVPPLSLGLADKERCHVTNLRLRIRREGSPEPIALYPAQMQAMAWDFIIDDSWRLAKPGFYIGEVLCCEEVVKRARFRLSRNRVGDITTSDMIRDMCDDGLEPACAEDPPVCCPPVPDPCNYGPVDCCPAPALPTSVTPAPNCQTHTPSCPC